MIPTDIAIGVRQGNDELEGMLNGAIKALHEKGIYAQLQKKYFGGPGPLQQLIPTTMPPVRLLAVRRGVVALEDG